MKLLDNIAEHVVCTCVVCVCMRVVRFVIDKIRLKIGSQSTRLVVIDVQYRMLKSVYLIS